jgi:hypothetical protein
MRDVDPNSLALGQTSADNSTDDCPKVARSGPNATIFAWHEGCTGERRDQPWFSTTEGTAHVKRILLFAVSKAIGPA